MSWLLCPLRTDLCLQPLCPVTRLKPGAALFVCCQLAATEPGMFAVEPQMVRLRAPWTRWWLSSSQKAQSAVQLIKVLLRHGGGLPLYLSPLAAACRWQQIVPAVCSASHAGVPFLCNQRLAAVRLLITGVAISRRENFLSLYDNCPPSQIAAA